MSGSGGRDSRSFSAGLALSQGGATIGSDNLEPQVFKAPDGFILEVDDEGYRALERKLFNHQRRLPDYGYLTPVRLAALEQAFSRHWDPPQSFAQACMEKQVRLKGVIEMAAAHLDRLQYALASAALDHEKQRERMKEEAEAHIDSVDSNLSLAGVPAAGQHDAAADSITAGSNINDEPTATRSESAQAKGRAKAVSMVTRSMTQKRPSSPPATQALKRVAITKRRAAAVATSLPVYAEESTESEDYIPSPIPGYVSMPPWIRVEMETSSSSSDSPKASLDHDISSPVRRSSFQADAHEETQGTQVGIEARSGLHASPAGTSCWEDLDDEEDAIQTSSQADPGLPFNLQTRAAIVRASVAHMSSASWRTKYGVADYGNNGVGVEVGATRHPAFVARTTHTANASAVQQADAVRSSRSDHRDRESPFKRAASVTEAPPDVRSPAAAEDHDILEDLERGVGSAAASRRLAAVRMRAARQSAVDDTPDQSVATGSKRKAYKATSLSDTRLSAQEAARKSLAEHISGDEGICGKSARSNKRTRRVRTADSNDMANESVDDTPMVNTINARSWPRRLLSAAPPVRTPPIAEDGRASRGGASGRTAQGRSGRRAGRAGSDIERNARDSSVGDTIDNARTRNESGQFLIVRLHIDGEKLKQVGATTAQNPVEARPLATETQPDFPNESHFSAGTRAQVDASPAIISHENTDAMDTNAANFHLRDLAVPREVENPSATSMDDTGLPIAASAGLLSTSVKSKASTSRNCTTSSSDNVNVDSERPNSPLRPQVCRVHVDQGLFIWPGCPYGHAMPDGMWCTGDGVLFRFSRPEVRG